jgi:hypothetical protein
MTALKYPTPYLNALPDGCVMDMRVKLAMEIIKTPGYIKIFAAQNTSDDETAKNASACALNIAEALYAEAERRQLVEDLPSHADLTKDELNHIRRQAAGNVIGQLHAQKVAASEQASQVMQAPAGMFRG